MSLVVCGAFLVGGSDGLECFLAVYYALYLRGVLYAGLIIGVDEYADNGRISLWTR